MSPPPVPARARLALALVLLAGTALILPRLASQSLWVDEAFTILPVVRAANLKELLAAVRATDTQPPGSHLLLFMVRDLVPRTDFGWRLPSFVLNEAAIALLFGAAARRWGVKVGIAAAVCAQASPFLAFYAMEARNYALWWFATAAALYAMARWAEAVDDNGRGGRPPASLRGAVGWGLVWGAANALGLWTHLFHLFAIMTQLVLVLGLACAPGRSPATRTRILLTAAGAQAFALALFGPWLADMLRHHAIIHGVGWTRSPAPASLLYYPFAFVYGFSLGPDLHDLHLLPMRRLLADHVVSLTAAGLGIAVLAAAIVGLARAARADPDRRWAMVIVSAAVATALVGPVAYLAATSFPLLPRHLVYLWPALPLLQALAFVRLPRLRPALVCVLALQILALGNLLWNPAYAKDDERGAVRFAEARSGPGALIIGHVAPLYTVEARGLLPRTADPGDAALFAGAAEVWFVDDRAWEDPGGRYLSRLRHALERNGLEPAGEYDQFRGVLLRHWRRPVS